MKIFKNLERYTMTGLLIIVLVLNYIIDNVLIKKTIAGVYIVVLLLHSIYIALKNRPISKKNKTMLIIMSIVSILVFIYLIFIL